MLDWLNNKLLDPVTQMAARQDILLFCEETLNPMNFHDYCPNGLHVEGKEKIEKIVSGVTASLDLIEAAISEKADMILVHHGYFWKGENPCLTGIKARRVQQLMRHQINLLAYHLPLDAHPELGNNAQIAAQMHWQIDAPLPSYCPQEIGYRGKLSKPMTVAALEHALAYNFRQSPLVVCNDNQRMLHTVAWCSGAAADDIVFAAEAGVDAFVTGEPNERSFHLAKEYDLAFFACGHHATERPGVQALGQAIAKTLNIAHKFIDIPCPV